MEPKSPLSRSSSRKKRSTTNLADLRLAPLSSKYAAEPSRERNVSARSPYDESDSTETYFARQHSSYLQGKSAPTTPGILSRSASRTKLGGGLSRRTSIYDEEGDDERNFAYTAVTDDRGLRAEVGSGHIPKAKSEALLQSRHTKSRSIGSTATGQRFHTRRRTGDGPKGQNVEEDWMSRASAATNAMLQESKGQSWLASRESSANLVVEDASDDDEGYEEAAALSAWTSNVSKLRSADPTLSPTASRWGSRYGSRPVSRKTSRRGSLSGRTPMAGQDNAPDYFTQAATSIEEEITSPLHDSRPDEEEVARLTSNKSFGLGTIVDRFMGFNVFHAEERETTSDDEAEPRPDETKEEAESRRTAEAKRKREEKAKLVAPRASQSDEPVQAEGGWSDAAWLLSVASKAMF